MKIMLLILFLSLAGASVHTYAQEPVNEHFEKKQKERKKDQEKAEKEILKQHEDIQSKETKKMMKETKKKSKRIKNGKSADPFWKKWFIKS